MEQQLAHHWMFAFVSAMDRLEDFVWEFDEETSEDNLRGRAYLDVEPEYLISVIDGFLAERENFFKDNGARRARLEEMRQILVDYISGIYERARQNARQEWESAAPDKLKEMMEPGVIDFRKKAKDLAPENLSESATAWFIEGFSRQWQHEWMEHWREHFNRQK